MRPEAGELGELAEGRRGGDALVQQFPGGADSAHAAPVACRRFPSSWQRVPSQQPGQSGMQDARRGERIAVLGRQVRRPDQLGAPLVGHHRLSEARGTRRRAQVRRDIFDHPHAGVQHAVRPAFRDASVAGMDDFRVQQGHRPPPGPQQAPAMLELLDALLDQGDRVRLVRVLRIAVRDVRGPQQVHARNPGVPPVPRLLHRPSRARTPRHPAGLVRCHRKYAARGKCAGYGIRQET